MMIDGLPVRKSCGPSKCSAVGELELGVAHELRTSLISEKFLLPLSARQAYLSLLSLPQLRHIRDGIAQMEMTIQGLIDFSQKTLRVRSQRDVREALKRYKLGSVLTFPLHNLPDVSIIICVDGVNTLLLTADD
jgi:hypothetical protein